MLGNARTGAGCEVSTARFVGRDGPLSCGPSTTRPVEVPIAAWFVLVGEPLNAASNRAATAGSTIARRDSSSNHRGRVSRIGSTDPHRTITSLEGRCRSQLAGATSIDSSRVLWDRCPPASTWLVTLSHGLLPMAVVWDERGWQDNHEVRDRLIRVAATAALRLEDATGQGR